MVGSWMVGLGSSRWTSRSQRWVVMIWVMAIVWNLQTISQVAMTLTRERILQLGDLIAADVADQGILPENVRLGVVAAMEIALEKTVMSIVIMGDAMEIGIVWIEIVGIGVAIDIAMTGIHLVNAFAGDPCMDQDPQNRYGKGGDYNREVVPRGGSDRYGSKGPAHHDRGSYKDMPAPYDRPRLGGGPPSYDGPGSLEVPSKSSPATPRTGRQLKTPGSGSDSISTSPLPSSRTPKDRSPKVIERRSPRSPVTEKKRPSRVSELESQLTRLQDDLKKTKDQLGSSESWKRRAQQEAEESKKQLLSMSAKLEESQQQLLELSASEEARVQELRKISQDRDRAWESELEAVQKQHCLDSAALASAMNEIQKLKKQLGMVAESEAAHTKHAESAHSDIQSLQVELSQTLFLVEKMNTELSYCKESEASALEVLSKTSLQLESAKATADTLRSEGLKATEAYNSLALELEQSKARVNSLEGLVSKLQADVVGSGSKSSVDPSAGIVQVAHGTEENEETKQLKAELNHLKFEVGQLRSALDAAEIRYQEEYIQSTLQIRSAYEQVDRTKSESCLRESELEAELKKAKDNIEELKEKLMDKETKLQSISKENEGLNLKIERNQSSDKESKLEMEVKKSEADLADLKANLMDKETEFQSITEENEMLKLHIQKREMEKNKVTDEAIDLAAAARDAEQAALMKLGYLTEEAEKNSRRAARVTEQLDAAQAANSEMEAELRRLKVQSDQWRKAAEAAAAMLSTGNNGKYIERAGSLDNNYHSIGAKMGSPFSDDMDDDSPKKKNGNMLKKIGVLWKKGQK